jgi:hypothetical protein
MVILCLLNIYLGFVGLIASTGLYIGQSGLSLPLKCVIYCVMFMIVNGATMLFYNLPIIQSLCCTLNIYRDNDKCSKRWGRAMNENKFVNAAVVRLSRFGISLAFA